MQGCIHATHHIYIYNNNNIYYLLYIHDTDTIKTHMHRHTNTHMHANRSYIAAFRVHFLCNKAAILTGTVALQKNTDYDQFSYHVSRNARIFVFCQMVYNPAIMCRELCRTIEVHINKCMNVVDLYMCMLKK